MKKNIPENKRTISVKNVVVSVSSLHLPNGLTASVRNLADALSSSGIHVEFFLQWGADPIFHEKYSIFRVAPGIRFTHFMKGYELSRPILKPFRKVLGNVFETLWKLRIKRRISKLGFQETIFVGAALESYNFLNQICPLGDARRLFQVHTSFSGLSFHNLEEIRKALKHSIHYSVLSREDGRKIEIEYGGICHYIPNMVDVNSITSKNIPKSKKIVFAGRLTPEKQVEHIIEAFSNIESDDWVLEIYGSGPEEDELRNLSKSDNRINILQPVNDVSLIFSDASINVLASVFEGFGMTVVEAGQFGVPTIAYDVSPGVRNAVGTGGILVPSQDKLALQQSMKQLMFDQDNLEVLASKAFEHSQQFRPAHVLELWQELFDSI